VPPVGTGQGVQEAPQVAGSVESTQAPLQAWRPVAQAMPQAPPTQVAVPLATPGQTWHALPQAEASVSLTQPEPHLWNPVAQTKPHAVPSQVAWVALAGTGHGVHDVPQACSSSGDRQSPEQACVPVGQLPHDVPASGDTQAPWHRIFPVGQEAPQAIPSQVAVPPAGALHGVQAPPQVLGSLFDTQAPAHR
jgi:hypothetical protein